MQKKGNDQIDRDAFARRVSRAIKQQGLTYREVAQRAQAHLPEGERLSDVNVWSYAKGRSFPRRASCIDAIGKVLGFAADELRPHTGETPPVLKVVGLGGAGASINLEAVLPWPVAIAVLSLVRAEPSDRPGTASQGGFLGGKQ